MSYGRIKKLLESDRRAAGAVIQLDGMMENAKCDHCTCTVLAVIAILMITPKYFVLILVMNEQSEDIDLYDDY